MPREGCSSRTSKWKRSKGIIRRKEGKTKPLKFRRNMRCKLKREILKIKGHSKNVSILDSTVDHNETENVAENIINIINSTIINNNNATENVSENLDNCINSTILNNHDNESIVNMDSTIMEAENAPENISHAQNLTVNNNESLLSGHIDFTKRKTLSNEKILSDIKTLFLSYQNIPNTFLSGLLKVLKKHPCFLDFPEDARTLLKSKDYISHEIRPVAPGFYYHFGIAEGISVVCKDVLQSLEKIDLVIGIDGLPLTKSTNNSFWPILAYIDPYKSYIFLIGVYYGQEKPKCSNDFLKDFVNESLSLEKTGFSFSNRVIPFSIKLFCLDAPAKSFVLKVKGHSGFSSCTRCDCQGIHVDNRVSFPTKSMNRRTYSAFLNREDPHFHLDGDLTILSQLNIDLVTCFSLDYMHLVCLGTMKKYQVE